MPDQAAAKQYLHDRNVTFNKDYFWSNLTEGYLDVVEAFLKLGMSPNTLASGRTDTPLMFTTMYCSEAGEAQMSLLLLIYGADPNVKDDINRSAIHAAAEHCPAVVVKALLMAGARTNDVTNGGSTVLSSAVGSNDPEIVRMILNSGYKIKNEPSYLLSSAKNAEIKQMLIKAGVKK
jgi:ankyrin repeat protein